jgi:hypothetical protein
MEVSILYTSPMKDTGCISVQHQNRERNKKKLVPERVCGTFSKVSREEGAP